jgi:hypothetical protein
VRELDSLTVMGGQGPHRLFRVSQGFPSLAFTKHGGFTGENTSTGCGHGAGELQDVNTSSLIARMKGSRDQVVVKRS